MAVNYIHTIEHLVEDYGWDVVIDELMLEAESAQLEELEGLVALIDAAIMVGTAQGEVIFE